LNQILGKGNKRETKGKQKGNKKEDTNFVVWEREQKGKVVVFFFSFLSIIF
jgi:hypothetical protein